MPGPFMCGDLYCSSCGPAQGNGKCPACGRWTADGGCVDPAACQKVNDAEADSYAREMADDEVRTAAARIESRAAKLGIRLARSGMDTLADYHSRTGEI